jgi:hypothetical protein
LQNLPERAWYSFLAYLLSMQEYQLIALESLLLFSPLLEIFMSGDLLHPSQEDESELLDRFKTSSQHEMAVIETILKYMIIYQEALHAEQSGDTYQSRDYLNLLYEMPEDLDLKMKKWIQSIDHITQLSLSFGLSYDELLRKAISSTELAGGKSAIESISIMQNKSNSPFEEYVLNNISNLESLIDSPEDVKFKVNRVKFILQRIAWKKAKNGWEKILKLKTTLLKMGGNDFFELFDNSIEESE